MGLDFTTSDAEATAIRAPKGVATVLALITAAIAGLFLFGASSTGAVEPDERARLSIPLSIPWESSITYTNASGETQYMYLSCLGYQRADRAPWGTLSVPSVTTAGYSGCWVGARLSSAHNLAVLSDNYSWCDGDFCSFQMRPGDDIEVAMKPPVDARPEPRRDLSAPYLWYRGDRFNPQLPGVTVHDVQRIAFTTMSVPLDPDSLEIVDHPEHADAWVTADGQIAVNVDESNTAPNDRTRYRLCDLEGRCAESDLYLYYAQAPNPVDGTWRVPAEANPGLGWLDDSDPNYYPFAWVGAPTLELLDPPDFGEVDLLPRGQFAYYPQAGFKGVDSFTYRVCDTEGLCGEATVTLLVGGIEDPSGKPMPEPGPTPKPDPKDDGKLTDDQLKEIAEKKLAEQELDDLPIRDLVIDDIAVPPTQDNKIWTGETTAKAAADAAECTITGTDGDDVLIGTPGPDVICGLGGNDIIRGKGGNDVLRGGPGDDQLNGGPGRDHLYGGSGRDELLGKRGADRLRGGKGPDELRGGKGADRMWGNAGEDVLRGNAGDDLMRGGKGDDIMFGGAGADVARGGAGADRIWGGKGDDNLRGNAGRDVLFGNAGTDRLIGGSGKDLIGLDDKIR